MSSAVAVLAAASIAGLAVNAPLTADASGSSTISLSPVADTYVSSGAPNSVRGSDIRIQASRQPGHVKLALLRFAVPNLSGRVISADLILTRDTHHLDSVVYANEVSNSTWSERATNYHSAPAPGAVLDQQATGPTTRSVDLDVTRAVVSNKLLNVAITSRSTGFASFRSREWGAGGPRLQLVVGAPGTGQHKPPPSNVSSSTPAHTSSAPSTTATTSSAPATSSSPTTSSAPSTTPATSSGPATSSSPTTSASSSAPGSTGASSTQAQPGNCVGNAKGIPPSSAYLGATAGGTQSIAGLESQTGMPLALHRSYYNADQVGKAISTVTSDLATGRLPWISFKLPYSWADMAAGRGDAWAIDLVQRLARVNGPVWLAFHHEPEGDGNMPDWTAMQRHLAPIVHKYSSNVAFTTILIAWDSFYGPSQYRLSQVWPGDGLVDIAGFDMYNNYGSNRNGLTYPMLDPMKYFGPISAWASAHRVHWGLAETGYTGQAANTDPHWLETEYSDLVSQGGIALDYFDSSLNSIADWTLDIPTKINEFTKLLRSSPRICR